MADHLHESFSAFRETILTAIARLEFQIRDSISSSKPSDVKPQQQSQQQQEQSGQSTHLFLDEIYGRLSSRILQLEKTIQTNVTEHRSPPPSHIQNKEDNNDEFANEIIKMEQPIQTRNVLVSSVRSTPALAAAVAAASLYPPTLNLTDAESISTADAEDIAADDSSSGEEEGLQSIVIKGKQYYMDSDMIVYEDNDEGYVEIGKYDSLTDSILRLEETQTEGDVVEEEEEQPDLEQFTWKGNTYYKDTENNVYHETDDGYEQIGSWNGKKVILLE